MAAVQVGVVLPLFYVSTISRDRCRPYGAHAVAMGKEVISAWRYEYTITMSKRH